VFDGDKVVLKKSVEHAGPDLKHFARVFDQYQYRLDLILKALAEADIPLDSLDAVVGRGGLMKPLTGGTYSINQLMVDDLKKAEHGEHAANLGAVLAFNLAAQLAVPAFIVDPVSVDEMEPVARISGLPDLERVSMVHTLNMKAVARKVAGDLGRRYEELNLIVAHLGTGVSVSVHRGGRMIDVINPKDEGAFSPDRCGGLPASQLVKLCFSGRYSERELLEKTLGTGGMFGYLGTKDIREAEDMAAAGNEQAGLVLAALAYQVAKEIGAMAAVLAGKVDRIILTGGIAYSTKIVNAISERVAFIAPVVVIPGEEELEALAMGALRVLRGEESAKVYQ
jgi:butyrate kinase